MSKTPEDKVKDSITEYLDSKNIYWERRQAMAIGYKKGSPDLWAVINGHHIEIETKAAGGMRSAMQLKWETKCKKMGASYICCNNLNDFIDFIKSFI